MDHLLTLYPPGYIEIMGSISIQIIYLIFGLIVEHFRPAYTSSTTPKMIVHSLRNHVIATSLHILYVFAHSGDSVLTRTFIPPYQLPSLAEFFRDLAMSLLLRDVVFWAIHRVWHLPVLYPFVHAKHHEITHPVNHHIWTISYMSAVDFVLLYGIPVVAVAKVLEMNILTTLLFAFVSAAGEQVKLVFGDEAHDEHHLDGGVNFGVYGLMDWVFGTGSSVAVGKRVGRVH